MVKTSNCHAVTEAAEALSRSAPCVTPVTAMALELEILVLPMYSYGVVRNRFVALVEKYQSFLLYAARAQGKKASQ